MRGQWGDGAQQLPVTELRDKGREVGRREVEAALEEKHSFPLCPAPLGVYKTSLGKVMSNQD